MLGKLDKDLEPFDEYLDLMEPSDDFFMKFLHDILVFQKIGP